MVKSKNHNSRAISRIITSLLLLSAISLDALGAKAAETNDLFAMSLEQLMDVGVYAAATITEKNPLKTPACVTTITAEDIARTPARNILDLMEIYVPGMLYLNHSTGPLPGMRGIIADKPYKFLVNINGMNINTKAMYGARLELLNWELSDIDRIEIVRGPGSVTYGPGAIGGVINIYTKTGKKAPGLEIGGSYWGKYDSRGNYVSYGRVKDDFQLYSYFSVTSTDGISPDLFGTDRSGKLYTGNYRYGYVGEKESTRGGAPPGTYMGDYFNQPQIKAHLDIQINDNWRFWGRYATESSQLVQYNMQKYWIDGRYSDIRLQSYRYFQFVLENNRDVSNNWNLKSTFGLRSIDVRDIQKTFDTNSIAGTNHFDSNDNDKDNLRNYGNIFSEWEYYARFMLNYEPKDSKLKGAIGFEFSYDTIRPAWGKNKDNGLRLGSDYGIISGPSSDAYGSASSYGQVKYTASGNKYYPVGQGFEAINHAFIGELNYQFTPKTSMILSGRLDKNTYTDYMFSPRFALIHELKKDHYLKFIAQQSVRMNTMDELYINHEKGKTNFPEKLATLELIYSGKIAEHWLLETSVFYNKLQAIGWDGTSRSATPVGQLRTIGMEIDLNYKKEDLEFGINHSITKQLSWKLASNIAGSGISYSDYQTNNIESTGNDLSNWANQATKLYTNINLAEKKLTLHADAVAFWGFEGFEDGLNAFEQAYGNTGAAAQINAIRKKDAFGALVKGNLSLTYHVNKSADFMVFVQNIPVVGGNKRYSYNSGETKTNPEKTSWVEEPMVVGFTYKIRF